LKFGIYSTPWTGTYAGHIGGSSDNQDGTYDWIKSGKHNENYRYDHAREHWYYGRYDLSSNDVEQWAEWGLDYLKYDWYPNDEYSTETMSSLLLSSGRDIILSLSNSAPFSGAPRWMKYAECWRTTGDIRDEWKNMSRIGFQGQDRWAPYKGPGHWPDADMLVVGQVGWGDETHPSRLTADEQYTHISLWALLASPLLIGCDIADMDDFTFSLLSNNEVISVNQDPLGVQASKVSESDSCIVYEKPLEDGSVAVGLFNISSKPRNIGITLKSLGISDGNQTIRDLWRQNNIAVVTGTRDKWEISVAPHGVELVKILPGISEERKLGRYRK
jgi:alpha-galactosidase